MGRRARSIRAAARVDRKQDQRPVAEAQRGLASQPDLPTIPAPPRRTPHLVRINALRHANPTFRWLWGNGWWIALASLLTYALAALAIGGWRSASWSLALDIMLGDASPSTVHGPGRFAAVWLAIFGWLIIPAVIGTTVSLLVGVFAVHRVTAEELERVYQKALDHDVRRGGQ